MTTEQMIAAVQSRAEHKTVAIDILQKKYSEYEIQKMISRVPGWIKHYRDRDGSEETAKDACVRSWGSISVSPFREVARDRDEFNAVWEMGRLWKGPEVS